MLRSRILAAATAAVLMLGISVGGASAALATPPPPPPVPAGVTITEDNGVTCNGIGYTKPPSLDNIEGGTGSATFDWGVFSWSGSVASWTVNPGWTVDLCVKGGSTWPLAEIDLGVYVGSSYTHPQSISHLGYRATPPVVEPSVASASISPVAADCEDPTAWNISGASIANATWGSPFVDGGSLVIVATATGDALFAAGEGVSGDRTTKTFSTPYEEAGVGDCGPPEVECVVVVWEMPSWINGTTPTWPQDFVAVYPFDCDEPVDAPVPDDCDTQYQLDKYFDSDITDALIAGGFLNGPNNPDEDLVPGGWGNSYKLVKNPACERAVAAASVVERDCFVGTSFDIDEDSSSNVTWGAPVIDEVEDTISITATATDGALFAEGLDGVSDDRTTRTFTEPYEEAGGDDCVAPSIDVAAAFTPLTCDTDSGSFTVGLFNPADANADKLLWTTTTGTVPSTSANAVSEPGVVTVTVRVADAHLGDFAVNETSSLGTVSIISVDGIETALITWTFTFTPSDDCELGSVVVPIVTYEDYCEGVGPNALRVATFTVTDVENASYTYTVNGGAPIAITFDGAETVTIAVDALDNVVVTATPAEGFELNDGYEPWSHSFIGAAFCPGTFPATEAAAEITPGDCEGNAPEVTLTNEGGVIWTLNGQIVAGNATHVLPWGAAVQLTAELDGPTDENPGGWTWSEPDQQTEWTADGMSDEECLSSLAFTGADSAAQWLGAAAVIMMLVGMGAVIARRRVEA